METEREVPPQAPPTISHEKLDKENFHFSSPSSNRQTPPTSLQQQQGQSEHLEKPKPPFPSWIPLSPSPSTETRRSHPTTPSLSTPMNYSGKTTRRSPPSSSYASSTASRHPTAQFNRRTPTGTSKLLRDHFGKLSLLSSTTPTTTNNNMDLSPRNANGNSAQRKRRILDSGPVRVLSPSAPPPSPIASPSSFRCTGFDGSKMTTSLDLLKSTVSSRSARRAVAPTSNHPPSDSPMTNADEDNSSTDRTITSSDAMFSFTGSSQDDTSGRRFSMGEASISPSIPVMWAAAAATSHTKHEYISRRLDCGDPVAWTLWKGGDEDLPWLLEQDRRAVPKVTADIMDIYGETMRADIARPIPIVASRRPL